jgi:hypothetical protein
VHPSIHEPVVVLPITEGVALDEPNTRLIYDLVGKSIRRQAPFVVFFWLLVIFGLWVEHPIQWQWAAPLLFFAGFLLVYLVRLIIIRLRFRPVLPEAPWRPASDDPPPAG